MLDSELREAVVEIGRFFGHVNRLIDSMSKGPEAVGEIPRFITRHEAARMLDVSCRTIDRYIRQGRLQKRELGQSVRVLVSDVEALVK